MPNVTFLPDDRTPRIVGSFGSARDCREYRAEIVRESCDIAEIRLDLFLDASGAMDPGAWAHLTGIPLLFTARRGDEGGRGNLDAAARAGLLMEILDEAALIDIEVASIPEMEAVLIELRQRGIPWVASFHDFEKLPDDATLQQAESRARDAGAAVFKAAAMLESPADLARLAAFQLQDHALPVSTMGMGPMAPVSRLLCAQAGSVLNYGYLGATPTAPGQWDSATLGSAISRLAAIRS